MKKHIFGRKRIEGILVTICLLFVFLTGCGKDVAVENSTIKLHKDGSLTQTIIEEFPEEKYSFEELRQMNQSEVDEYNASISRDAVTIQRMAVEENQITVVMDYQNVNAYFGLNGTVLYFGTVEQAKKAGYNLDISLKSIKDDSTITPEELSEMENRHIAIINEATDVLTYSNILYVSEGVSVSKNKKLATIAEEKAAYIVFK